MFSIKGAWGCACWNLRLLAKNLRFYLGLCMVLCRQRQRAVRLLGAAASPLPGPQFERARFLFDIPDRAAQLDDRTDNNSDFAQPILHAFFTGGNLPSGREKRLLGQPLE